jgi:hypothetical protein
MIESHHGPRKIYMPVIDPEHQAHMTFMSTFDHVDRQDRIQLFLYVDMNPSLYQQTFSDHLFEIAQDPSLAFDLHLVLHNDNPEDQMYNLIMMCVTQAKDQLQVLSYIKDLNNIEAVMETC